MDLNKNFKVKKKIWMKSLSIFLAITMILTIFQGFSRSTFAASNYFSKTDESNGNWSDKYNRLTNTPEGELMIRIGDIDNFGGGWPTGSDPFSGNQIRMQAFPTPSLDERNPTDRIMVPTGFDYDNSYYWGSDKKDAFTKDSPRSSTVLNSVDMYYDLADWNTGKKIDVKDATLQMYLGDLQPKNANRTRGELCRGTNEYTFTIGGVRVPEIEKVINSLDQTGYKGQLITVEIPQRFLSGLNQGQLFIKIDDAQPNTTGDGFAIDFVKLLINKKGNSNSSPTSKIFLNKTVEKNQWGLNEEFLVNYTIQPQDIPQSLVPAELYNKKGVDISLVIDKSGSMKKDILGNNISSRDPELSRIEIVKDAADKFIDKFQTAPNARIGVVNFESQASVDMNLTGRNGFEYVKNAINTYINNAGTGTGDGLRKSYWQLKNNSSDDRKQFIVLLTDGEPTAWNSSNITTDGYDYTVQGGYANSYCISMATEYAKLIARERLAKDTSINTFMIAFTKDATTNTLPSISAIASNNQPGFYKEATTADDLNEVYDKISQTILSDLSIYGLQLEETFPNGINIVDISNGLKIDTTNKQKIIGDIGNINYKLDPVNHVFKAEPIKFWVKLKGASTGDYVLGKDASGNSTSFVTYKDIDGKEVNPAPSFPAININIYNNIPPQLDGKLIGGSNVDNYNLSAKVDKPSNIVVKTSKNGTSIVTQSHVNDPVAGNSYTYNLLIPSNIVNDNINNSIYSLSLEASDKLNLKTIETIPLISTQILTNQAENDKNSILIKTEFNSTIKEIKLNGTAIRTDKITDSDGKYICDKVNLINGNNVISVTVANSYNNITQTITNFNVDNIAPAAPVILTPKDNTVTKDNTPIIIGTGEAGATVTVYDGANIIGTEKVDNNGRWSIEVITALSDGTHVITATQSDEAGNISPKSNIVNLTVDTSIGFPNLSIKVYDNDGLRDYYEKNSTDSPSKIDKILNPILILKGNSLAQIEVKDEQLKNVKYKFIESNTVPSMPLDSDLIDINDSIKQEIIYPDLIKDKIGYLKSRNYNVSHLGTLSDEVKWNNPNEVFKNPSSLIEDRSATIATDLNHYITKENGDFKNHTIFMNELNIGTNVGGPYSDYKEASKFWGYITPNETGKYYFGTISDDGSKGYIIVDNKKVQISNQFKIQGSTFSTDNNEMYLEKGKYYPIYLEYSNWGGKAQFRLLYKNSKFVTNSNGSDGNNVPADWFRPTTNTEPGEIPTATFESTAVKGIPFPEKTGNYYIAVKAENISDKARETIYGPFMVDKTPPTGNITSNPIDTEWTDKTVNLTIKATDEGSGVNSIQKPDGTWVNGDITTYEVSQNGTYKFTIKDNAGNTFEISKLVNNIDKGIPTAPNISLTTEEWTKNDVVVTISGSTSSSGIKKYQYRIGENGTWQDYNENSKPIINKDGITTIYARAISKSEIEGDTSNKSAKIDKVIPDGKFEAKTEENKTVTLTLTATDIGSGVNSIQLPSGNWVNGSTANYNVSANGKYSFKIKDNAGNIKIIDYTISTIDKSIVKIGTFSNNVFDDSRNRINVVKGFSINLAAKVSQIQNARSIEIKVGNANVLDISDIKIYDTSNLKKEISASEYTIQNQTSNGFKVEFKDKTKEYIIAYKGTLKKQDTIKEVENMVIVDDNIKKQSITIEIVNLPKIQ